MWTSDSGSLDGTQTEDSTIVNVSPSPETRDVLSHFSGVKTEVTSNRERPVVVKEFTDYGENECHDSAIPQKSPDLTKT